VNGHFRTSIKIFFPRISEGKVLAEEFYAAAIDLRFDLIADFRKIPLHKRYYGKY
jgi:hypothetical protein